MLDDCTLAISGFGGGRNLGLVLHDWFRFLGGRPGEVVYVDGGSDRSTLRVLADLLREGHLDRLECLGPHHPDNSKDRCFVQEYRSGVLATKPWICFVKLDTLCRRDGHDRWLDEAIDLLRRTDVFAFTHTHMDDPPVRREGDLLAYDFASLNFAIMSRQAFDDSMAPCREFVARGFQDPYPWDVPENEKRLFVETAWQRHCLTQDLVTLGRAESTTWAINHVNASGRKLRRVRRAFMQGRDLERTYDQPVYYRPKPGPVKRFGQSIENAVRALR